MKLKLFLFISVLFMLNSCKNNNFDTTYEKVVNYCGQGDYIQAQKILEKEIPIVKRDYNFYITHGMCYIWNNVDLYSILALKDFKKAYAINPHKYWVNYFLGVSNYYLLNYEESLKYFSCAKDIYENSFNEQYLDEVSPFFYLAKVYYYLGNINESRNYIENSFEIDKNFQSDLYILLGLIESSFFYSDKLLFV